MVTVPDRLQERHTEKHGVPTSLVTISVNAFNDLSTSDFFFVATSNIFSRIFARMSPAFGFSSYKTLSTIIRIMSLFQTAGLWPFNELPTLKFERAVKSSKSSVPDKSPYENIKYNSYVKCDERIPPCLTPLITNSKTFDIPNHHNKLWVPYQQCRILRHHCLVNTCRSLSAVRMASCSLSAFSVDALKQEHTMIGGRWMI